MTAFSATAPVALMLGSGELLRRWLQATLANLATDDRWDQSIYRSPLLAKYPGSGCTGRIRVLTGRRIA